MPIKVIYRISLNGNNRIHNRLSMGSPFIDNLQSVFIGQNNNPLTYTDQQYIIYKEDVHG